jgi:hypothetical protein
MALPVFFTCMLGPAGLLLYVALVRPLFGRGVVTTGAKRD